MVTKNADYFYSPKKKMRMSYKYFRLINTDAVYGISVFAFIENFQ